MHDTERLIYHGNDSYVFRGEGGYVFKLYERDIGLATLKLYQTITAKASAWAAKQEPYQLIFADGQRFPIYLRVVPILDAVQTPSGVVFSRSSFVPGCHMESLFSSRDFDIFEGAVASDVRTMVMRRHYFSDNPNLRVVLEAFYHAYYANLPSSFESLKSWITHVGAQLRSVTGMRTELLSWINIKPVASEKPDSLSFAITDLCTYVDDVGKLV